MEERLGYFLLLLLAGCRSSAGASDIIFDVFEYGGSYRHLNSPMKFIPPSRGITEVLTTSSLLYGLQFKVSYDLCGIVQCIRCHLHDRCFSSGLFAIKK